MAQIDAFFKLMNDEGASDLHLMSGQQPVLRIRGDMERVKFKVMDNEVSSGVLSDCPSATGASLTLETLIETIAGDEVSVPSLTVNSKLSAPT